ncbi:MULTISPECIES: hypothetical protein [Yersinia]|uniref:hypothetical protein n=1 Tax=Yersinia TaxID=629 RepID=UPI000EB54CD6|nr:hypothetical protein [Yersinia sp. IP36721]
MSHSITPISKNSKGYRSFVLAYRRSTAINPIARYEVLLGDQSFGYFYSQSLATQYIDWLYSQRTTGAAA